MLPAKNMLQIHAEEEREGGQESSNTVKDEVEDGTDDGSGDMGEGHVRDMSTRS